MRLLLFVLVLPLAACSPQAMVEDVTQRAARSTVETVLAERLPRPAAERAASCVLAAATGDEVQALARDVGTRAGTATYATIRAAASRPAALACLQAMGLPGLEV